MCTRALTALVALTLAAIPLQTGAAPQQTAPSRVRVGSAVQYAQLLSQVPPVYPDVAKQARIQGTVRLQTLVARDGSVAQLEVLSGHPLLFNAAIEAVKQWKYKPTLLNGEPVEVVTTVDVQFALDGSSGAAPPDPATVAPAAMPPPPPGPDPRAEITRTREGLAATPNDAALRRRLGFALLRNRELDSAIAELKESLRLDPENADTRMRVAATLLREKFDYHGAVAEYREVLLRAADHAGACRSLAQAHEYVYDFVQAAAQYLECARLRPTDLGLYGSLAQALYRSTSIERATTEFRKHATMHPSPFAVHEHTVEVLQSGSPAVALAQAKEVLRAKPDSEPARQAVARIETWLIESQGQINDVRAYIARTPGDANGYQALAFLLHQVADHDGAFAALRDLSAALPLADNGRLADEAVDARGADSAISELRKLVRSQSHSAAPHVALAELLLRRGQVAEATELGREAVRLAPESLLARQLLARALTAGDEPETARAAWQAMTGLRPGVTPPSKELMDIVRRGASRTTGDPVVAANEASAVGALRTLNTVQFMYKAKFEAGYSPTLAALGPGNPPSAQSASLIDPSLASGTKSGYTFVYATGAADAQGHPQRYTIHASPVEPGKSGRRFFFTDQSGVIRYSNTGPAGPDSPPIG